MDWNKLKNQTRIAKYFISIRSMSVVKSLMILKKGAQKQKKIAAQILVYIIAIRFDHSISSKMY